MVPCAMWQQNGKWVDDAMALRDGGLVVGKAAERDYETALDFEFARALIPASIGALRSRTASVISIPNNRLSVPANILGIAIHTQTAHLHSHSIGLLGSAGSKEGKPANEP